MVLWFVFCVFCGFFLAFCLLVLVCFCFFFLYNVDMLWGVKEEAEKEGGEILQMTTSVFYQDVSFDFVGLAAILQTSDEYFYRSILYTSSEVF